MPAAMSPPTMPPPTVAAVVVTCNRLAQLRITLARLLEEPLQQICIVDNGAAGGTDGTGAWLAGLTDPRLIILVPARNLGGAGGFALGLAELEARADPDWIVVMDDDTPPPARRDRAVSRGAAARMGCRRGRRARPRGPHRGDRTDPRATPSQAFAALPPRCSAAAAPST